MDDSRRTKEQLLSEIRSLRRELAEVKAQACRNRRIELNLREDITQMTAFMEYLEFGIMVENEMRSVVYANQAFAALFGINCVQMLFGLHGNQITEVLKKNFPVGDAFSHRVKELVKEQKEVAGEKLAFIDGRELLRDYKPIMIGKVCRGHIWVYRLSV